MDAHHAATQRDSHGCRRKRRVAPVVDVEIEYCAEERLVRRGHEKWVAEGTQPIGSAQQLQRLGRCLTEIEARVYDDAVADYFLRHRVRPGMTGWAQVNGLRGEIDTLDKARRRVSYDLHYIDHWSLWLDVKILLLTAITFFRRQNAE